MKTILVASEGFMLICLYPEYASMKLSILKPNDPLISRSMLGRRYVSFGHTLLRSVYSTQILHFPELFSIVTMLVIKVGYLISFMKLKSRNFFTSSLMTSLFSSPSFLLHYVIGLASLLIDSWLAYNVRIYTGHLYR